MRLSHANTNAGPWKSDFSVAWYPGCRSKIRLVRRRYGGVLSREISMWTFDTDRFRLFTRAPYPVGNPEEVERTIDAIAREPNSGLLFTPDNTNFVYWDLILRLAAKYRLPAVFSEREMVEAGGLMALLHRSSGPITACRWLC
jgi:hypothetical protein